MVVICIGSSQRTALRHTNNNNLNLWVYSTNELREQNYPPPARARSLAHAEQMLQLNTPFIHCREGARITCQKPPRRADFIELVSVRTWFALIQSQLWLSPRNLSAHPAFCLSRRRCVHLDQIESARTAVGKNCRRSDPLFLCESESAYM